MLRGIFMAGCLVAAGPVLAETWPAADWQSQPTAETPAAQALDDYAFPLRDDVTRKGVRTDALLVIKDGVIVHERYAAPTSAQSAHLTWSMSKSLFASVLGVAYGEGRFKLDDAVAQHYAPFAAHPDVKMGHLLNWASGLDWQEDYEYAPLKSSVVAMLYTRGRGDMAAFTATHGLGAVPGTRFRYSSGDSNVLGASLKSMLGEQAYADYPWTALFEPLGIRSAVWERDASGTFVASSYAYMTARDLARVGLLMQRGGRWGERQLLPQSWVAFNRTPFANYQPDPAEPRRAVPGGQWWLNTVVEGMPLPWPDAPDDSFAALGHWGQALYVMPSRQLVVVRYADDRDKSFNDNELLKRVLAAYGEQP
ncbi:serine hydrolase [Pseudomonas sp. GOM6]|uniref:serine hydrolase domain-containing protein n=1 Tax=Pseudomonas sp. GOM6 TaxID=3036944 RepID=UPI0024091570|nr:serine hydrolase [Pseudomonas sp. GOM6]MDG1583189.1 serine hydrolase [Pseudomonas sp. GOM6]